MWDRPTLKREARQSVFHNYWRVVAVCLLMAILAGGLSLPLQGTRISPDLDPAELELVLKLDGQSSRSNSEIVNEFIKESTGDTEETWPNPFPDATRGLLAGIFNNVTQSKSLPFGILNALNQFLFQDRIGAGIIILVGVALGLVYFLFGSNMLKVGKCRFFLETRRYYDTKADRVLFPYRMRRTRRTAWTMFLRSLFHGLWCLTIVGGVVKHYSYLCIPYILAENPGISHKEAFRLSREMMRGEKWCAFKMDLTFLPWWLLGFATLGIVNVLYVDPYHTAAQAGLYMQLRGKVKAQALPEAALLDDDALTAQPADAPYPQEHYPFPPRHERRWTSVDYHRRYSLTSLVLIFFAFAIVGWIWEVCLCLFTTGKFVNRGTMAGPWLPIYGTGGVLVLLLLRRFVDRPWLTFLLSVVVCGVVEYFTSWALEMLFDTKWWDYHGYLFNINGRVSLEGLLVFGLGSVAAIYVLAPALDEQLRKLPKKLAVTCCCILVACFACDFVYSQFHPNTGQGITDDEQRAALPPSCWEVSPPQPPAALPFALPDASVAETPERSEAPAR